MTDISIFFENRAPVFNEIIHAFDKAGIAYGFEYDFCCKRKEAAEGINLKVSDWYLKRHSDISDLYKFVNFLEAHGVRFIQAVDSLEFINSFRKSYYSTDRPWFFLEEYVKGTDKYNYFDVPMRVEEFLILNRDTKVESFIKAFPRFREGFYSTYYPSGVDWEDNFNAAFEFDSENYWNID